MSVRFGEYVLDTQARQLLRSGGAVHLTPKAFQLLELLVEKRPGAVSKAEIHDGLWPNTFVSEVNLAALVFEVRAALGDKPEHARYVRTVRGFGYAFCGPAAALEQNGPPVRITEGCCRLIWKGRSLPLPEGETLVGRTSDTDLCLDSPSVSRHHARIVVSGRTATLDDLSSKNGTFVSSRRVTGPIPLADGDELRFGSVHMAFRVVPQQASTWSDEVREEPADDDEA